jgi:hypothetical protein
MVELQDQWGSWQSPLIVHQVVGIPRGVGEQLGSIMLNPAHDTHYWCHPAPFMWSRKNWRGIGPQQQMKPRDARLYKGLLLQPPRVSDQPKHFTMTCDHHEQLVHEEMRELQHQWRSGEIAKCCAHFTPRWEHSFDPAVQGLGFSTGPKTLAAHCPTT